MRSHANLRAMQPQPATRRTVPLTSPVRVPPSDDLGAAYEVFSQVQSRLFGIAYRMLGTVTDAEDIVQEAWVRWQRTDRSVVHDPAAFLATTTTRLAINQLRSARARHEEYIGPWLPEPVDTAANPELTVEQGETLEIAVLFLLERLSPHERAAFVLREAFGYAYDRIAELIETTETNARQLVSRARKHLVSERHTPTPPSKQRRLLAAFLDAARAGDLATLESLFADDIASYSDGGGVVQAARIPLVGRERVAKFIVALSEWYWDDVDVHWIEANGLSAVRISAYGTTIGLLTIAVGTDGIRRLFWVANPAKLSSVLPNTM